MKLITDMDQEESVETDTMVGGAKVELWLRGWMEPQELTDRGGTRVHGVTGGAERATSMARKPKV